MSWERVKVSISGAAADADRLARPRRRSVATSQQERHTIDERIRRNRPRIGSSPAERPSRLLSPSSVPSDPVPCEPPAPARQKSPDRRAGVPASAAAAGPAASSPPTRPSSVVGLAGQCPLDLGQALALGLKLLDGHDLEQMPAAVERRTAPHLRRPVDQAQRRVVADRPAVGHVPHPAARARRRSPPRAAASTASVSSPSVHKVFPAFMTLLYPFHLTLSNSTPARNRFSPGWGGYPNSLAFLLEFGLPSGFQLAQPFDNLLRPQITEARWDRDDLLASCHRPEGHLLFAEREQASAVVEEADVIDLPSEVIHLEVDRLFVEVPDLDSFVRSCERQLAAIDGPGQRRIGPALVGVPGTRSREAGDGGRTVRLARP